MGWLGKFFGGGAKKEEAVKMESAVMKEYGKEVIKMAKDPGCGMEVDEKTATAKSEHMGKTYYFCAPACKQVFDENPAKYAGGGG